MDSKNASVKRRKSKTGRKLVSQAEVVGVEQHLVRGKPKTFTVVALPDASRATMLAPLRRKRRKLKPIKPPEHQVNWAKLQRNDRGRISL